MIFYYDQNVGLLYQANAIMDDLEQQYNIQNLKLKSLMECLKTLNTAIQSSDNFKNPDKITSLLHELKTNIDNLRKSIHELENISVILGKIFDKFDNNIEISNSEFDNYNNQYLNWKKNMYVVSSNIEDFFLHYTKNLYFIIEDISLNKWRNIMSNDVDDSPVQDTSSILSKSKIDKKEKADKKDKDDLPTFDYPSLSKEDVDANDNNTLLISEIKNKVFLPYRLADVQSKLKKSSKYHSLQDVIDKEYTISLDKYKNATISRFKETYNLMRKRERASIIDSLDLALELSFNRLLNPAIITACKSLDDLDVYLDCLALNELDKFNIFEIKYEVAPINIYNKKERF